MRAMKDSGVEWIGEIPQDWEVKPIKQVYKFQTGWTPTTSDESNFEGDNIWVNISDMKQRVIYNSAKHISDKAVATSSMNKSPKGSLLYAFKLSVGAVAFCGKDVYTNEAIATFLPCENSLEYLFYAAPIFIIENANENIYGAKLLNQQLINNAKIVVPPIGEQKRIANYLNSKCTKIDSIIAKQQAVIEKLKEYKLTVITEAVTKGLNPDVEMKDSGVEWIGEVPKHWEIVKLKYATNIMRGKFNHRPRNDPRYYDGKYPFVQTGDVARANKFINSYSQSLNELGYSVSKEFPKGSICMTIAANIGDVAVLNFDACFPDSVVGFVATDKVYWEFLYNVLKSMKSQFMRNAIISTQMNLNIEIVKEEFIPIAPFEEQKEVVLFLNKKCDAIDTAVNKKQNLIEKLISYKKSLIYEVVTGKKKV